MTPDPLALYRGKPDPTITTCTATTALKGSSHCPVCGSGGLFSFSRGREWSHDPNCPWVIANTKDNQ